MKKSIHSVLLPIFVSVITCLVYLPSLENQFVRWDDPDYVYENPYIQTINFKFIQWAFFNFYFGNWHPLTWLSYAFDYTIWGLNPFGYHLTNLLLHGINTFLVVILIKVLWDEANNSSTDLQESFHSRSYAVAAITGLLFGIHPLHVESVAWVSQRKDVLCAFFFLISIFLYIRHTKSVTINTPSVLSSIFKNKYYLLTLSAFIFAILSKPMAITFPFVLLILDFYPLGRISKTNPKTIFIEKLPFFLISIFSAIFTFLAQYSGGAVKTIADVPLSARILVSFQAIVVYIQKMFWPYPLLPFYPFPTDINILSILSFQYLFCIAFVVTLSLLFVFLSRRKHQHIWLASWSYYIIMLLPVLGIIKVGSHSMADRYTYLPSIGPFLIFGLATTWLINTCAAFFHHKKAQQFLFPVFFFLLIFPLSYLTVKQIHMWRNGEVLWTTVITKDPNAIIAYLNRGAYYLEKKEFEKAMIDFTQAIIRDPGSPRNYFARGSCFLNLSRYNEALIDFTKAIQLSSQPNYSFYNVRAVVFVKLNRTDEALQDYAMAISLNPNSADVYYNRGNLYARLGLYDKALTDYTEAIRLSPFPNYDYYYNRSIIYIKLGLREYALKDRQEAMRLKNKSFR